jgi:hypothetical protein
MIDEAAPTPVNNATMGGQEMHQSMAFGTNPALRGQSSMPGQTMKVGGSGGVGKFGSSRGSQFAAAAGVAAPNLVPDLPQMSQAAPTFGGGPQKQVVEHTGRIEHFNAGAQSDPSAELAE